MGPRIRPGNTAAEPRSPTPNNLGKWLLDPIPANSGRCAADLTHSGAFLGGLPGGAGKVARECWRVGCPSLLAGMPCGDAGSSCVFQPEMPAAHEPAEQCPAGEDIRFKKPFAQAL